MSVTRVAAGCVRTVDVIQLRYAGGRELVPPLVRIGGVVGFVGLLLSFLHVPVLCRERSADGYHEYAAAVHAIVPAGQFLFAGAGLALVIAGHALGRRAASVAMLLALMVNLAAVGVAVCEVGWGLSSWSGPAPVYMFKSVPGGV